MTDPSQSEPLLRLLAWIHPAWMLGGLLAAGLALRAGLRLRRGRLRGERRPPALRRRHLRFAKPAVAVLMLGFAAGPISAVWLRGWSAFHTFHAYVGLAAASLFLAAAVVGRRLERGRSRALDPHALLGGLAFLFAALAAIAGMILLP